MRVLQINTVYSKGSTGRIVASIEQVSKNNAIEPYVAYGFGPKTTDNHYRISDRFSTEIHAHVYSKLLDNQGFGSRFSTIRFIKWIENVRPDIIHFHNLHGNYINVKLLIDYINSKNIPVIWTFHDCWPITGHCTHFDFIECNKWKNECHRCPLSKAYPASLFLDMSRRNFRTKMELFSSIKKMTIVPVSEWLSGIIKQSYLKKYDTKVIYNGINLDVFKPQENDIRNRYGIGDKKLLLGVGTAWSTQKGLNEFIVLSKLSRYQVVLVGISDALKCTLPSNIITIGRTNSQKELAELYCSADVLVNPTYNDSFPTINLEAMACGTPVVTYRTGGSPESINVDTGLVVGRGDMNSLISAIDKVCQKDKREYKEKCVNHAKLKYNEQLCFQQYLELYKSSFSPLRCL